MSDTSAVLTGISERALVRLPGAELPLVELETRAVVADFLARSLLWRRRQEIQAVAGQGVYCLTLPQEKAGIIATQLLAAFYGNTALAIGAIVGVTPNASGSPRMADMSNPIQVQLWPPPPTSEDPKLITLDIAWGIDVGIRNPESLCLPPEVLGFIDVIVNGLLYRMFSMPDKPWSSQKHAAHHSASFRHGVGVARRAADLGRAREGESGALRWRFPRI